MLSSRPTVSPEQWGVLPDHIRRPITRRRIVLILLVPWVVLVVGVILIAAL